MPEEKIPAKPTIADLASFCKRTGFIFQSSEIYGGFAGFWDYGPRGSELKNNLKQAWWKFIVQDRHDVVGIDASIITHPKVWIASGHVANFSDPLVDCKRCKTRHRADHLIEDVLRIPTEGMSLDEMTKKIHEAKILCPSCKKGELTDARKYNLMFKTTVGPVEDDKAVAYLRPETAQAIFADFKNVYETSRVKLPFGIAQMGKAYRNEIAPRDFLFRSREFEQMELEFFVHPEKVDDCPLLTEDLLKMKVTIYSEDAQIHKKDAEALTVKDALKKHYFPNPWLAYWSVMQFKWFINLGVTPGNLRFRQHRKDELAHYAKGCVDIEYNFPFGWKEIHGMADRGQFDLTQHQNTSSKSQEIFDEETKKRVIPYVAAEPSQGVDRAFLAFLIDAWMLEGERFYLKLHPKLAPIKVAIFPLMPKDGLDTKAEEIFQNLKDRFTCFYDDAGSIGRRYARMDEAGTCWSVTVDYDSLKDNTVTLRDRNTTKQARIKIKDLESTISDLMLGKIQFESLK